LVFQKNLDGKIESIVQITKSLRYILLLVCLLSISLPILSYLANWLQDEGVIPWGDLGIHHLLVLCLVLIGPLIFWGGWIIRKETRKLRNCILAGVFLSILSEIILVFIETAGLILFLLIDSLQEGNLTKALMIPLVAAEMATTAFIVLSPFFYLSGSSLCFLGGLAYDRFDKKGRQKSNDEAKIDRKFRVAAIYTIVSGALIPLAFLLLIYLLFGWFEANPVHHTTTMSMGGVVGAIILYIIVIATLLSEVVSSVKLVAAFFTLKGSRMAFILCLLLAAIDLTPLLFGFALLIILILQVIHSMAWLAFVLLFLQG
jgi:hypothetical protein